MLKLNKQQIDALANKIHSEVNSEEVSLKKYNEWLNSNDSEEYRNNVRPLFKKVKKLLETNNFLESIAFEYLDSKFYVDQDTTEIDIAQKRTYSKEKNWQFKKNNPSLVDIRDSIIVCTIEVNSLDEVMRLMKKIYEY